MATQKKMNENERKVSSHLIKNLATLMAENEIHSDAECMRKIKEKTGFDFNQSKFSDIKNSKTFPTTMELIAFSDFFKVSIDFLLGREQNDTPLTIYETSKFIAKMFDGNVNLMCQPIDIEEYHYNAITGYSDYYSSKYNVLFFSTADNGSAIPETLYKAEKINSFIENLIEISGMKHKMKNELYKQIVDGWLTEQKEYDMILDSGMNYNQQQEDDECLPF